MDEWVGGEVQGVRQVCGEPQVRCVSGKPQGGGQVGWW